MGLVVDRLKSGNSRPRTLPALRSAIDAILYKQVGEPDVQAVICQATSAFGPPATRKLVHLAAC
jgi:hypothetical protein